MQKQLNQKLKNFFFGTAMIIAFVFVYIPHVSASEINETILVNLANQDRAMYGLPQLKQNPALYSAAREKAQDMLSHQYFEHYSPQGKSPWDFIHASGYNYEKAGENLAIDFATSEGINKAWMASTAHRANILKPEYEDIAIAVLSGKFEDHNTTVVVQMFGQPVNNNQFNINYFLSTIKNFILGF